MTCQLSILIPALNESGNINELIYKIKERIKPLEISYEIVVIDGGSIDATQQEARDAGARVLQQKERGYGSALKEAFAVLQGEYIITMDADFSHDPYFIQDMWNRREESSAIIASRYIDCGSSDAPYVRKLLSRILNRVFSIALSIPLKDFSSGFRMYRRTVLNSITIRSDDYDILEEIIVKLYCEGYTIKEIPFHYSARHSGRSKARIFRLVFAYVFILYRLWKLRNSIQSADYDSRAYDSKLPPQRYWQRKRYRIIQDMLKTTHGVVVDIGCGSSKIIQNHSMLIGFDIKMSKLRFIRSKNNKVACADIFNLPLRDSSVDGIVCSQVIEHVSPDVDVLPELKRVLKKGGTLIVGTPDYGKRTWRVIERLYKLILPNAYADEHITHYSLLSLKKILLEHSFKTDKFQYIVNAELILSATRQ